MLDVSVSFSPAPAPVAISWKLEIFDRCTGNQTEQAGQRFVAPAGWNHIVVTEPVQLPQQKAPVIVVVTTSPAAAASAPVSLSPPAC
jgi:hypothetical protein